MWWVGSTDNQSYGELSKTAVCSGINDGVPTIEIAEVQAAGTYVATVCGTATFDGTYTVAPLTVLAGIGFWASAPYTNPMAGFISGDGPVIGSYTTSLGDSGTLSGHLSKAPNTAATQPTHGGDVNTPVPPPPTTNTCIDNYAVDGTLQFS